MDHIKFSMVAPAFPYYPVWVAEERGYFDAYGIRSEIEITGASKNRVPHFLPGENPFLNEFAQSHGIPEQAVMGGAETMYPEYRLKLKAMAAAGASAK